VETVVMENLPGILTTAEGFPADAERVNDRAKPEFEALDLMKKGKAISAAASNLKQVSKLPTVCKKALEDLKDELVQLKEAVESIKNGMDKLESDGKVCATANKKGPVDCYKQIHGPI